MDNFIAKAFSSLMFKIPMLVVCAGCCFRFETNTGQHPKARNPQRPESPRLHGRFSVDHLAFVKRPRVQGLGFRASRV